MRTDLEQGLEHLRASYIFALRSLPDPERLQNGNIEANGFTFTKPFQIQSKRIELGWAFYYRYKACLEAFIKQQGVQLTRKKTLEAWMNENGIDVPDGYKDGFKQYRKVRSLLHHRDGQNEDGTEVHLHPDHMDQFYHLFVWIASAVAANNDKQSGHRVATADLSAEQTLTEAAPRPASVK